MQCLKWHVHCNDLYFSMYLPVILCVFYVLKQNPDEGEEEEAAGKTSVICVCVYGGGGSGVDLKGRK